MNLSSKECFLFFQDNNNAENAKTEAPNGDPADVNDDNAEKSGKSSLSLENENERKPSLDLEHENLPAGEIQVEKSDTEQDKDNNNIEAQDVTGKNENQQQIGEVMVKMEGSAETGANIESVPKTEEAGQTQNEEANPDAPGPDQSDQKAWSITFIWCFNIEIYYWYILILCYRKSLIDTPKELSPYRSKFIKDWSFSHFCLHSDCGGSLKR